MGARRGQLMNQTQLAFMLQAVDRASPAMGRVAAAMSGLHHSARQARNELGQFSRAQRYAFNASRMLGSGLTFLWAALGRLRNILEKAGRMLLQFARHLAELYKRVFRFIRRLMMLAAALAAVGFGYAAKEAAAFELSAAKVRGVTGATAEQMEVLNARMRDLAKTSIFTAGQFYEAGYYLASAGFAPEQISASIEGVTKLAEALGSDLATSTATVVATLSAFGMASEESTRIANVFAAANAVSQANMEKLTESLRYAAPVAGSMNVRFEETVAVLNLLFNAGLRGETAGAALRMMMLALIRPSKALNNTLRQAGLTMDDVNPAAVGLAGAFDALTRANISTADASQLFGARAVTAFEVLRSAGVGAIGQMEQAITGTNQAFEQAETQMDTLTNRVKYLISSVQELALVFGTLMVGPLKRLIKSFADFINWLGETREVRRVAKMVGDALEAMHRHVEAQLRWVQNNWARVWGTIWRITEAAVVGIAGFIGLIVGAYRFLVTNSREMGQGLAKTWGTIAVVHAEAAGFITRIILTLEKVIAEFGASSVWENLARAVFETMKLVAKIIMEAAKEIVPAIGGIAASIAVLLAGMAIRFPSLWPAAIKAAAAAAAIAASTKALGDAYLKFQAMKWEDVSEDFSAAMDKVGSALDSGLPEAFKKAWNDPAILKSVDDVRQEVGRMFGVEIARRFSDGGGEAGHGWIAGLITSMREGGAAFRQVARGFMAQAREEMARGLSPEALAGKVRAETMFGDVGISPELAQIFEQLTQAMEEYLGADSPYERVVDGLTNAIDRLRDRSAGLEAAMRENTAQLRKHLEGRWQALTGAQMRRWAEMGVARELYGEMHPTTLRALGADFEGVIAVDVHRAIMRSPLYRELVRMRVAGMTYGQLRQAGRQHFERFVERQVERTEAPFRREMAALDQATQAYERQRDYAEKMLEIDKERMEVEALILKAAQLRLALGDAGDKAAAAMVGYYATQVLGRFAGRAAEQQGAARALLAPPGSRYRYVPGTGQVPGVPPAADAAFQRAWGQHQGIGMTANVPATPVTPEEIARRERAWMEMAGLGGSHFMARTAPVTRPEQVHQTINNTLYIDAQGLDAGELARKIGDELNRLGLDPTRTDVRVNGASFVH